MQIKLTPKFLIPMLIDLPLNIRNIRPYAKQQLIESTLFIELIKLRAI